ncbi:MAG: PAS domain S-box protein [Acidobacteriota bacterium]
MRDHNPRPGPAMRDEVHHPEGQAGNWRDFLEHVPVGMVRVHPDGSLKWLNSQAAELFGFGSPEEALAALQGTGICLEQGQAGLTGGPNPYFSETTLAPKTECAGLSESGLSELSPRDTARLAPAEPDTRPQIGPPWPTWASDAQAVSGVSPMLTFEAWCHREGSDTWLARFRLRRVADGDGRTLHFEGVVDDITAPRRAREAKATSEARYRAIFAQSGQGIVLMRRDLSLTAVNGAFCRLLGFEETELSGRSYLDLISPGDLERQPLRLDDALSGRHVSLIRVLTGKGGSEVTVEVSVRLIAPDEVVMIFWDMTESLKNRQRLLLERQRLRTLLDAIPGPVWAVRQDMTLAATNAVYDQMTSQTRGCFCHGRDNTGQLHCGKCPTRKVLDTGLPATRECTFPDGRVFLINAVPFRDKDGAPLALGLAVDITAQKNLERQLTLAREQALAATDAKSRFLASMSHEIRTPLNGVLGNLQLLQEGPLDSSQEESVHAALGSGRLLMRLIDDILDLSKIESGTLDFTSEPVDLTSLISQVTGLFGALADAKGLVLDCSAPQARIIGDPARIAQIMLNLAGNAVKYTSKGFVRVTLALNQPLAPPMQSVLVITVEDSGPGIPMTKRQAVFEPFTQLGATARTSFGGVGLGLNIVSRLVRAMDGELELHDRSGGGTTVTVRLPVTVRPFTVNAPQPHPMAGRSLRVLVVEDERVNQRMLVRALERRGHAVTLAGDGLEALDALRAGSFDLVLMDIQMPRMNGLEATRAIRRGVAGDDARAVPIVSLTAHAMSGDKDRSLDAGVDIHMTKPVELSELDRVLARVAQAGPPR